MTENTEHNLIEYQDKPLELFNQLKEIGLSKSGSGNSLTICRDNEKVTAIVVELNKTHGVDICDLAVKAINKGFDKYSAEYILRDAIPSLTLDLQSLVSYLKVVNSTQYTAVKELIKKQPKFSRRLVTSLIELGEPFIIEYIPLIINSLPGTDINDTHQELLTLAVDSRIPVVQGAIFGLGNLKYDTKTDQVLMAVTVELLDRFLEKDNSVLSEKAAWSLCGLLYFGEHIQEKVLTLARRNDPKLSLQIIRYITNNPKYIDNSQWFTDLLMSFSTVPWKNSELSSSLDFLLSHIFPNTKLQEVAEQFLAVWIAQNESSDHEYKTESLFGCTLSTLDSKTTIFSSIVTRYLNHAHPNVNRVAADFVSYAKLYRKQQPQLDQATVQSLSAEELLYVSRKILGYFYTAEDLLHLFYSILLAKVKDNDALNLVASIFATYIGVEYRETTLDFLKGKLDDSELAQDVHSIITQVVNTLESNTATLNALPRLNELSVSNRQSYQIALAKQKYMSKSMEEAEEGSFTSMFGKIYLKYGKGSFNHFGNQYSEPRMLISNSYSMEMPLSESHNPVNAARDRFHYQHAKKGEL